MAATGTGTHRRPRRSGGRRTSSPGCIGTINGVLTGYTAYEILVTDDRGRDHLIWKGPGLILDLAEDWRTVKSAEAGGPSGPDEPPADQAEFSSDGDRR